MTFKLKEIGGDLIIESIEALTPADVAAIAQTLTTGDQERLLGWRLVAR